jgi:hypothetical protein
MYHNIRTFGDHVQPVVGDDGPNFQDHMFFRIQSGHFQIDPNQTIVQRALLWVLGLLKSRKTVFLRNSYVRMVGDAHLRKWNPWLDCLEGTIT